MATIAGNLKRLREAVGLTQEDLASASGLKQAAVSKYETGRTKPDVSSLLKLAVGLGKTVDELVHGLNSGYDLICHGTDRGSALSGGADAPQAAAGLLERIKALEARLRDVRDAARAGFDAVQHAAAEPEGHAAVARGPRRRSGR